MAAQPRYLLRAAVGRTAIQSENKPFVTLLTPRTGCNKPTAASMSAPAAGASSGLAVPSRDSWAQPRPPMHWKRPCAQIWSIWSPVSCRWQAGGSSTSMLPEHGQLMQYDVQDTSNSSCTHGSATGMVRWQPLRRICLLYTSPSPRDVEESRMPSSA